MAQCQAFGGKKAQAGKNLNAWAAEAPEREAKR